MPPKRASLRDRTSSDADQPAAPIATASAAPASAATAALWGDERSRQQVVELELREIMPNRQQPRANADQANIDELAASIREHGVLQPVIVRPIPLTKYEGAGRRYELIAGERRWRASAAAGRATIPALIREGTTDHRAMLELALIENVQRQDLHPLDEAAALGQMQHELGYSFAEIAERMGKSKAYVTNRMRLLQLDDDLPALVAARPDTIGHVYELARITDPAARAELIAAVRDEDLSRTATRARVQALLEPAPAAPGSESVFQKTDLTDQTSGEAEQAVFQKTDREEDNKLNGSSDSWQHPVNNDVQIAMIDRDMRMIRTVLSRWATAARKLEPERQTTLLKHLHEVSELLEQVAEKLT